MTVGQEMHNEKKPKQMLEHPVMYVYQAGGHISNFRHCVGDWLREEADVKVSVRPAVGSMYVGR